jgi:hypothetical protein
MSPNSQYLIQCFIIFSRIRVDFLRILINARLSDKVIIQLGTLSPDMWNQLKLPYFFERMIAFTIPVENTVIVLSYDGLHKICLFPDIEIATDTEQAENYAIYDENKKTLIYDNRTYDALGLYGGNPILQDFQGNSLAIRREREQLDIIDTNGICFQSIPYSDLSGDWAFASFSFDSNFIILGLPCDLYLFKRSNPNTQKLQN